MLELNNMFYCEVLHCEHIQVESLHSSIFRSETVVGSISSCCVKHCNTQHKVVDGVVGVKLPLDIKIKAGAIGNGVAKRVVCSCHHPCLPWWKQQWQLIKLRHMQLIME